MVRLHDIMSVDLITLAPEATLREAAELLSEEHVSGLPVVAGDRVVGVVSASDILEFLSVASGVPAAPGERAATGAWPGAEREEGEGEPPAAYYAHWEDAGVGLLQRLEEAEGPDWDVLEEHTVGEVMSRALLALGPDAAAREGARLMLEAGVHRILVMEDDRLVGVVSTTDIVKAVSQHGIAG